MTDFSLLSYHARVALIAAHEAWKLPDRTGESAMVAFLCCQQAHAWAAQDEAAKGDKADWRTVEGHRRAAKAARDCQTEALMSRYVPAFAYFEAARAINPLDPSVDPLNPEAR